MSVKSNLDPVARIYGAVYAAAIARDMTCEVAAYLARRACEDFAEMLAREAGQ